jgi:hypothetical protein
VYLQQHKPSAVQFVLDDAVAQHVAVATAHGHVLDSSIVTLQLAQRLLALAKDEAVEIRLENYGDILCMRQPMTNAILGDRKRD